MYMITWTLTIEILGYQQRTAQMAEPEAIHLEKPKVGQTQSGEALDIGPTTHQQQFDY